MIDDDMYRTLINDYADIIKDNNIVLLELIDDPEVSQIRELIGSLVEYDKDLICIPIFNWARLLFEKGR